MPNLGQRVRELADELGYDKHKLVDRINELELGFSVDNFMSRLDDDEVEELKSALEEADDQADGEDAGQGAEAGDGIGPTVIKRGDDEPGAEPAAEAEESGAEEPVVEPDEGEAADETEAGEAPEEPTEEPADEPVEVSAEAESDEEQPVEAEPAEPAAEADDEAVAEADGVEAADEEQPQEPEAEPTEGEEEAPAQEAAGEETDVRRPEDDQPAEPTGEPEQVPAEEVEDGAQVVGQIQENVVKDRLEAEGKEFKSDEEKKKEKKQKREKKSSPGKRVVEGQDLYDSDARARNRKRSQQNQGPQKTEITEAAEHKRVIEMEDVISVSDLAEEMGVKAGEVAMKLMESGINANVNTTLDYETAALVADEYGYSVENVAFDISDFYDTSEDPEEAKEPRPPVVTVMGHVDHGKTSLLDAIRETDVLAEEVGGITQHIGAYKVATESGNEVTFLDTPGHEAFTALRARGAHLTDVVVLVVAADDGVMPQTVEAINHAQEAGVPMIVAINKIDKETANPERIKQALTEYELVPEDWGGTTQYVEVSATEKLNISDLLESIELQAELEQLEANPDRQAQGLVVESELTKGRGPVASVLVRRGTLHKGDVLVSGKSYGSVRTMHDERGRELEEAGPSEPVEITGLNGVPQAGEPFFVVESESDAQQIADNVEAQRRKEDMATTAEDVSGGIEDLSAMLQAEDTKELKVIIKGDVQGSVEALKEAFVSLGNEEAQVDVIHTGVGAVTENDVNLAASSDTAALIVGFNVRPDQRAKEIADKQGVEILTHSVIYDAIDQVRNILEGLLEPEIEERVLGTAEVRELFESSKAGTIAGCYVTDGKVTRNAKARLVRDGRIVYETDIASLKRYQEDVKEVREGYECGITLEGYDDIKLGDEIEAFELVEVSATLN
ncbi:MAG: translation initiation factor IF-2 [Bradymonadaceae bacterium]